MNKEEIKQELNFEVFKTHIAEMLKKVYSKLDNEEKEFINLLVEVLNEKCEENERLKEIEKEHQRINGELREVIKEVINKTKQLQTKDKETIKLYLQHEDEYVKKLVTTFLNNNFINYKELLEILNKSK